MNPAYFSQPGTFGGITPGYELGHASPFLGYPSFAQGPFAALNPLAMINPGATAVNPYANPYAQSPVNPYLLGQPGPGPFVPGAFNSFGGQAGVSQIVPALVQLAQQISTQSVLTQQIGIALHQLVQQLAAQGAHTHPATGLGAMHSPFATHTPGAYPGFAQTPAWAVNRPQTIQ
jgi:hypothetical protein